MTIFPRNIPLCFYGGMNNLLGKWGRPDRPPKQAYDEKENSSDTYFIQKDYFGIEEQLLKSEYPIRIECNKCGEQRRIRIQDKHQVSMCKPCTRELRLQRRRERAAEKAIEMKIEEADESLSLEELDEA